MVVIDQVLQQHGSTPVQLQGSRRRLNSNDFISQMPDEILVMIISLLDIKEAVVTGSLATRWRFLWRGVNQLDFNACFKVDMNNFINRVKSIIKNYSLPVVQDFRIHYGFNCLHKRVIDKWLRFAVKKKVEFLELDFVKHVYNDYYAENYDFPSRLIKRNLHRSNATVVELVHLKKLILSRVNVSDAILQEFLTNSPHLETISIRESKDLTHIRVGGRPLSLKHFEIENVSHGSSIESIDLFDFDLESFNYRGPEIELRFAHLPNFKQLQLVMCRKAASDPRHVELNTNVLCQIASCASSLESLYIYLYGSKKTLMLDSFPELPNLKKLTLLVTEADNWLLHLASIVNACPNMHTFTIKDQEINVCLANLSRHEQLDGGLGLAGLNYNVLLKMICVSRMQSLSISLRRSTESVKLDVFPKLPNVKKLRLTAYGRKFDFLLDFTSILNACPNLETFIVEPFWTSPTFRRKKAKDATNPHQQLKVVEIAGYSGRICDFELAAYIIDAAVALKKIVIDTSEMKGKIARDFSMNKEAARSAVENRIRPILPQGVELVIL